MISPFEPLPEKAACHPARRAAFTKVRRIYHAAPRYGALDDPPFMSSQRPLLCETILVPVQGKAPAHLPYTPQPPSPSLDWRGPARAHSTNLAPLCKRTATGQDCRPLRRSVYCFAAFATAASSTPSATSVDVDVMACLPGAVVEAG